MHGVVKLLRNICTAFELGACEFRLVCYKFGRVGSKNSGFRLISRERVVRTYLAYGTCCVLSVE